MRKIAEALARKKGKPKISESIVKNMTPEQKKNAMSIKFGKDGCAKPKTVIKAAVKPKVLEQTPTGMANSTKSSPYIPPAKKTTKPKL